MPFKKSTPSRGKKTKAKRTDVLKSHSSSEHRSDQRIPVQLLVDYKSDGNYLFYFCKDLGAGGVFIQTKSPLPQGSDVDLTFTIPDSKETLETTGKVIWVQKYVSGRNDLTPGMGVQFEAFGGEQRKILEAFVNRYHGDRGLVRSKDRSKSAS